MNTPMAVYKAQSKNTHFRSEVIRTVTKATTGLPNGGQMFGKTL